MSEKNEKQTHKIDIDLDGMEGWEDKEFEDDSPKGLLRKPRFQLGEPMFSAPGLAAQIAQRFFPTKEQQVLDQRRAELQDIKALVMKRKFQRDAEIEEAKDIEQANRLFIQYKKKSAAQNITNHLEEIDLLEQCINERRKASLDEILKEIKRYQEFPPEIRDGAIKELCQQYNIIKKERVDALKLYARTINPHFKHNDED